MNNHGKLLYNTKVDGMKSMSEDVNVGVYGIYTSGQGTGKWRYYLISYKQQSNGMRLTDEWHTHGMEATYDSIQKYAKEIQSLDDGRKACDDYKSKWLSGSNDLLQHKRDEKLNEILNKS